MQIIKTRVSDADGNGYETYGIRILYPDGEFCCDDISPRVRDLLLFCRILRYFPTVNRSNIENFTADYINLLDKYAG